MNDIDEQQIAVTITEFIEKRLGRKVDSNTLFFSDLELTGLDADQFLMEFSEEFKVDFKDLVFSDYFDEVSIIPFAYWFRKRFFPLKASKHTCDLDHLVSIVKKGFWYPPH